MANELPSFQCYPRDFLADTTHMTAEEVGGYWLILCSAWLGDRPGFVPNDQELLRKMARLDVRSWRRAGRAITAALKISDDEKWMYSKRMVAEHEKSNKYLNTQSEAGKRGAKARWGRHSKPSGDLMTTTMANDSSASASASASAEEIQKKPEETLPSPSAPIRESFDLEAIYALYPRKGDGKAKGIERLKGEIRNRETYEQALLAARHYAEKADAEKTPPNYVKRFDTWCNKHWRDYVDGPHIVAQVELPRGASPPSQFTKSQDALARFRSGG